MVRHDVVRISCTTSVKAVCQSILHSLDSKYLYVIIYVNAMKSGLLFYDSVLELWKKNFISQVNFDQYANL